MPSTGKHARETVVLTKPVLRNAASACIEMAECANRGIRVRDSDAPCSIRSNSRCWSYRMTRSPFCLGSTGSLKENSPTRRSRNPHWRRMSRTPTRTRLKGSTDHPYSTRSNRNCCCCRRTHRRANHPSCRMCCCRSSCTHSSRSSRLGRKSLCKARTGTHYMFGHRPQCTKNLRCMRPALRTMMCKIRFCPGRTCPTSSGTCSPQHPPMWWSRRRCRSCRR